MVNDAKRITYIDIAKGAGIVLMVMGHVSFGSIFYHFIHAFHMPLFIFLSGFLFTEKKDMRYWDVAKKRMKQLLLPYLIFGVGQYIIWLLLYWNREENLLEPLKNLLWCNTNSAMPIAGALWYLTCLFIIDMIFLIIYRKIRDERIRAIVIIIFVIVGTLIPLLTSFRLPWGMDVAFVGLGIYFLGYLTKQHQNILERAFSRSGFLWLAGACITVILIFMNGTVNLREGNYAIVPLFWINMLLASIIIMYAAKKYEYAVDTWNLKKNLHGVTSIVVKVMYQAKKCLCYIGKNSIVFLCLNQLIILLWGKCWSIAGINNPWLRPVIVFLATMITLMPITYIIMNTKLKFIAGK